MKANGMALAGYSIRDDKALFDLTGVSFADALSLSGATITITEGDDTVEVTSGWKVKTLDSTARGVRVTCEPMPEGEGAGAADAQSQAVAAFARIAVASLSVTDDQAVEMAPLYPEWSGDGVIYTADSSIVMHGGALWRCTLGHTSQADWVPGTAPSLWSRIDMASDGIRVWRPPTCAEDAWNTGDRCHHPGASGPVWESLINGNDTEPAAGRWWAAVSE